jgi:hypothetical protein
MSSLLFLLLRALGALRGKNLLFYPSLLFPGVSSIKTGPVPVIAPGDPACGHERRMTISETQTDGLGCGPLHLKPRIACFGGMPAVGLSDIRHKTGIHQRVGYHWID